MIDVGAVPADRNRMQDHPARVELPEQLTDHDLSQRTAIPVRTLLGQRRDSEEPGKPTARAQHPWLREQRMNHSMTWSTFTQTNDSTKLGLHPISPTPLPR